MSKTSTGYMNTGNMNTGNMNTGNMNTGNRNTGNMNSGNRNTGNRNTGYWNTGDMNSGYWNTGDMNSGNWNTGNMNSGYMNSNTPTVRMFNQDTGMSYTEVNRLIPDFFYFDNNDWVPSDEMTEEKKKAHPEHETTGGYLRVLDYHEAWRRAWDQADDEDRRKVFKLPNWNNDIFEEITGIDAEAELNKLKETIEIDGVKYDKDEVEKRLKDIKPVD